MHEVFANYHTILRRHRLTWILTETPKVSVAHVLSAIRPTSLKDHLESDLAFSHQPLRNDLKAFLQHAIKLTEAFQLVRCGHPSSKLRRVEETKKRSGNRKTPNNRNSQGNNSQPGNSNTKQKSIQALVCLREPNKRLGTRELLKDFPGCLEDDKSRILKD